MPVLNIDTLTDQRTRAWLYRVLLAVAPLLAAYGIATGTQVALWVAVGGAVLGNGVATYNTSTKSRVVFVHEPRCNGRCNGDTHYLGR